MLHARADGLEVKYGRQGRVQSFCSNCNGHAISDLAPHAVRAKLLRMIAMSVINVAGVGCVVRGVCLVDGGWFLLPCILRQIG